MDPWLPSVVRSRPLIVFSCPALLQVKDSRDATALATIIKILNGRLRLFKVSNNRLKRLFSRNTTSWGGYLILAIG